MSGEIRIAISMRPFTGAPEVHAVPHEPGKALGYYLDDVAFRVPEGRRAVVHRARGADVRTVPVEAWDAETLEPGDRVAVAVLPRDDTAGIVSTFLTIAALALILIPEPGTTLLGTTLLGTSITVGQVLGFGLSVAAGLLARPPEAKFNRLSGEPPSRTFAITGISNQLAPFATIPKVLGKHRLFPSYGARWYTEIVGGELYFYALFVNGLGPLRLSEHKIGETDALSFDGVEIEDREGRPTDPPRQLFRNSVFELPLQVALTSPAGGGAGAWHTFTTENDTEEVSFDLTFPQGLFAVDLQSGGKFDVHATVQIEISPAGQNAWAAPPNWVAPGGFWPSAGTFDITTRFTSTGRFGNAFRVAKGKYDVRFRRTLTQSNPSHTFFQEILLTAFRSIRHTDPIALPGVSTTAIRIKSTDQLNGVLQTFNLVAESELPTWDGAQWVPQYTSNPVWCALEVLRGAGNRDPIPDSDLDLARWKAAADQAAAAGREFNAVIDFQTRPKELVDDILAVARARLVPKGTKYSVAIEEATPTLAQVFSPHAIFDFEGELLLPDPPHGFRVRFVNRAAGYQQDEVVVYADGYDAQTATKFEETEAFGIVDPAAVWKHFKYLEGALRARPEVWRFKTTLEHFVCAPGDTIGLVYDVIGAGLGSGRVTSATVDDVTVTDPLAMAAGVDYSILFKYADGTRKVFQLAQVGADGAFATASFAAPIPAGDVPAAGDQYVYGRTSALYQLARVISIRPTGGHRAEIVAVPAATELATIDDGLAVPTFTPKITRPIDPNTDTPAKPVVLSVRSDEYVMEITPQGTLIPRIVATLAPPGGGGPVPTQLRARFRRPGDPTWTTLPLIQLPATEVAFQPVVQGETYELAFQYLSALGVSEWTFAAPHTVVGKSTRPPDVTGALRQNDEIVWTYPNPPPDLAGFLVRSHPGVNTNWADAAPAHAGIWPGPPFPLSQIPPGQRTILIKAVDEDGNESAGASVVLVGQGDPVTANVVATRDYRADGYPGTITGGAAIGGRLAANATSLLWPASTSAPLWPGDPAALLWPQDFGALVYEFSFTPPPDWTPGTMTLVAEVAGPSFTIEYRPRAADTPLWPADTGAPLWPGDPAALLWPPPPPWLPWPGSVQVTTPKLFDFRISIAGGTPQGAIDRLEVVFDVPDVTESLEDVVIQAGGSRLPITRTYRRIVGVAGITIQDDGNGATGAIVVDKDVSGPLVKTVDPSGTPVQGLIDVERIQGY